MTSKEFKELFELSKQLKKMWLVHPVVWSKFIPKPNGSGDIFPVLKYTEKFPPYETFKKLWVDIKNPLDLELKDYNTTYLKEVKDVLDVFLKEFVSESDNCSVVMKLEAYMTAVKSALGSDVTQNQVPPSNKACQYN
jgi:hypothetical protein